MIVKRAFLILLGLLILMGPVTAYYASPSGGTMFSPSDPTKIWIIADVGQQNVIKLVAYNNTHSSPIINAPVTFSIDNPLLGTITPVSATTDTNGVALCTFTVNTSHPTSGTARITADVVSYEGATGGATYHSILNWDQKIDHNVPYNAVFVYSNAGAVESVIPVKISIFDRWGNKVDNRYETEKSLPSHNVTLHVNGPSPPNNCGFTDFGLVHDKTVNLDSNGEVTIKITPATKPGWHYILMDPMGSIPEQMKLFNTVANGVPFAMSQSFSPDGVPYATVLADGTSKFNFYYTLFDKYGNPTQNQSVWINTSVPGEESLRQSLENGQIWSTYGPKSFTGLYTINAIPVGNTSLTLSKVVRFYNTSPTEIELSANPESMPSLDANPSIYSNVSAKVIDVMGNGVAGEPVTFTFHDVTSTPASAGTTAAYIAPSLSPTTQITDSNGYATVKFYPASYATVHQTGYVQAVTGNAKVTATWNGIQKDEPVTWKNYPYLSAIVAVNPQQVKVGDTVNVSIKLNGDGWALYRYPIDVNLVMDRSGSMAEDINGNTISYWDTTTPSRLAIAKTAATNFILNMSADRDRAGLWSYSTAGDVTQNAVLQSPFGPVTTAVSGLSATGSTSTREATKDAIADMIANPNVNTNAVRAIIIETDGDWNNEGTPIAHDTGWSSGNPDYTFSGSNLEPDNYRYYDGLGGTLTTYGSTNNCSVCAAGYTLQTSGTHLGQCKSSSGNYYTPTSRPSSCTTPLPVTKCTDGEFTEQNLSIYAKDHNIRLYFIFFAGTPTATAVTDLSIAANATGGFYQHATSAADLSDAYNRIAGDLVTEAGVDTTVSLDFGNLIVNNQAETGGQYFAYVGDPVVATDSPVISPGSTMLDKYNKTRDGIINQHLIPGYDENKNPYSHIGPIIINQTNYWNANSQHLAFNVSTVNVNETWQTDFRLKVLQPGNILIFGPQSQVCFKNGAAGDSCMTLPNISTSASMNPFNIGVSEKTINIGLTCPSGNTVTGTMIPVTWTTTYNGADMITEEVSYVHDNDPPVKFDVKTLNPSFDLTGSQSSVLDMEKLPPGGYTIWVNAYTADASAPPQSCGTFSYTTQGRAFIKLE